MSDKLLSITDVEEALSLAYVSAVAARSGYVVSQKSIDRDSVDLTIEAGGGFRPKIDLQLKATINLAKLASGDFSYPCKKKNYEDLRVETQTPRILVVLDLPKSEEEWIEVNPDKLIMRNCAYWVCLKGRPPAENSTSISVTLPKTNRFDVEGLKALMEHSRKGTVA